MTFIITATNIFLATLIFYELFKKLNTYSKPLVEGLESNSCPKNMEGVIYKQEAKLDKFTTKLKDIDSGLIIVNNKLKENETKIKKNAVNLKSASNKIKNEANEKMKKLDNM
jgi:hypothetical protein|uniref:Uncharacterized protein n=1 Tax=viral metagenome TaxID=1070528 RepID=A0A6C0C2N3_9ZZZZ